MTEYTYQVSSINGGVDTRRLFNEIIVAGYDVAGVSLTPDGSEVNINSTATKPEMDAVVAAHEGPDSLAQYKKLKYKKLDTRTAELIDRGFQYAGKVFSLSQNAQSKMMGVHQVRTDPMLVYPVKWNTKDDNDYYNIADSDEMHLFYMTGVGTYKAWVDSGTDLKGLVREATSKAEVDAIVDPR